MAGATAGARLAGPARQRPERAERPRHRAPVRRPPAPTGAGTRRRRPRKPAHRGRDSRTGCRPRASPAASRTSRTRPSRRSTASGPVPFSAEQARAALASLPENTQRGVGQLVSEHGAGAREHLAYQALGEWSPEEREALRTLAAANPDVRAQAIDDVVGGEASGADTPAAAGPVGETPMNAEPRDVMRDSTQSPPSSASPTSSATKDGGEVGGSVASAGPDSPPPATRPPVREPRGPHPDEPFPNG